MKIIGIAIVLSFTVMVFTSCNTDVARPTKIPISAQVILPTSTNTRIEPTFTLLPKTPNPVSLTKAIPATFVDIQDGKKLINEQYGFTITLPSDLDVLFFNPTDDQLLSAQFASKYLSDGGQIMTWFHVSIENHTYSCHSELTNSSNRPVKVEQVTLGKTPFTKVYTPDLDKDELQTIEYMAYDTDFCIHFSTGLAMYYFDRGDAKPSNMLSYVQDEIDSIISTFEWVQ